MEGGSQIPSPKSEPLFKKLLGIIQNFWRIRFVRFLVVGGINTGFGYLIYSIFILLKIHYSLASLFGTIIGVIFNFFTTGNFVFRNKNPKLIIRFCLVYGVTYLINLVFLRIFNGLHMNMVVAGGILLLPMALVSYFLNKVLVFSINVKDTTIGE